MPNPFYQVYLGPSLLDNIQKSFLISDEDNNFGPSSISPNKSDIGLELLANNKKTIKQKKIYEDILEFGDVQRGLLGVTGQSLNSENAKELGINKTEGFYVNETDPEMGAHIAGMRNGDIILQIDDVQINKFSRKIELKF